MRRGPVMLLVGLLAAPLLVGGCRQSEVRVAFRPPPGAQYRYEVKVSRTVTVRLEREPVDRTTDNAVLTIDNQVISSTGGEVRMQVQLHRANSPDRTFIVRFDRAAQLAGVEAVEGLPPTVLGSDTFPEFLPAAAAAPPDRPIAPGEKWKIMTSPQLADGTSVRFEGTGQLFAIKKANGRKVAEIRAETQLLGLSSTTQLAGGRATLTGDEKTKSKVLRSVDDGAIETASLETSGSYEVMLAAPQGEGAPPVSGTVEIEVRSETRRLTATDKKAQP